jgi:predicted kinase
MLMQVNGETCGIAYVDLDTASAFKPEPSEGDDDDEVEPPDPCVYYPHVCAKNVRFECNFGQQKSDEHWEPLPAGFTYINDFALGDRVRAMKPPPLKQNCTVLMMCGMPGAGKTRWVHEYISEHPDEQWTVISTDAALEHMKLNGVGRHATDALRWDHIMGLAWKATYRWLILAPRRRRNYIIDGTNVAVNTRRRKLLPFKDFNKKCVVLMPDESTEIRRRARQEEMTGMPMPFDALTELKGLFCVPDERSDPLFAQIFYEELPESDNLQSAYNLAKKYNKEGKIWYLARYGYRYGHPAEATRIAQLAQQEREQDKYRSFPEKRVVGPIEQSRINLMGAAPTFAQNKRARLSAGDDTAPLSAAGSNDDRSQPLYTSHMMPSPAADVAATVGTPVFGAITEFAGELLTVTPIPTEPSTASTGQHDDIWPSTATGFFGTR